MTPLRSRKSLATALLAAGLVSSQASAVYLNPDGYGQALIFPYYTVQSTGADSWNTYLSVVNHEAVAKVARVSVREGRNGRAVATFNVYLAPKDVWTGAIVPASGSLASEAVLVTADSSCTNPDLPNSGLYFVNTAYAGSQSDGLGVGLDRTREGYVEIIEMATLTGLAAAAVTPRDQFPPRSCELVQGADVPLAGTTQPPTGGLSGTLTLINVNSGMDAAVNATALADLTTGPFYRNYNDPYPDFNAAEVRPQSHVVAEGTSYALQWSRGVDAVSSTLMSAAVLNEHVRDIGTASQTEWVLTAPTRRFYPPLEAPFARIRPEREGFNVSITWSDRDMRVGSLAGFCDIAGCLPAPQFQVASVLPIAEVDPATSPVLASRNLALNLTGIGDWNRSGWVSLEFAETDFGLDSLPDSVARNHVTGASSTGRFRVGGLPLVGFMMRTFRNGTLTCSTGACQGNYGGSFPHRYRRSITPLAP
jgi:hypothetical protein